MPSSRHSRKSACSVKRPPLLLTSPRSCRKAVPLFPPDRQRARRPKHERGAGLRWLNQRPCSTSMNFIVLVILIALLIWVLMQLSKKKKTGPEPLKGGPPRPDLANLKASDARAGDVISIAGVGDNFSDLDFTADRYSRIDAGAHPWIELGGAYRERRVSLRVAGDEDIEVAVHNDPRKLTIERSEER